MITALLVALFASGDAGKFFETHAVRMGTDVHIVIVTADGERASKAFNAALAEITRVEDLMTDWRDDSQLMAINRAAGSKPVVVDRELVDLLALSRRYSELSGGAFDVTYAAVGKLWDFKKAPATLPDPAEVARAVKKVDYQKLVLDPLKRTAFLREAGMRIGLGGFAKGYAVERAAEKILAMGLRDFSVSAGGDMRVHGTWSGKPWTVGIRDPRTDGLLAVVPVSNVGISTSGDYERFFMHEGKRYAHILDPRTGYPVSHTASVTIIARDCTISEGLSKSVFVLGWEKGLALVEEFDDVEAVVIEADGAMHMSSRLAAKRGVE